MNKFLTLCWILMASTLTHAQVKLTKADIAGKWELRLLTSTGKLYFDADKDSVWVGEPVFAQVPGLGSAQHEQFRDQVKHTLKNRSFTLNADGSYTLSGGKSPESGTYTFDGAQPLLTLKTTASGVIKTYTLNAEKEFIANETGGTNGPAMTFRKKKP